MRRGRGELKFVWTFSKFLSRLQAMRDIYQELVGLLEAFRRLF